MSRQERLSAGFGHRRKAVKRVGEEGVLLGGAYRHPDRVRSAEAVRRADDGAVAEEVVEQWARVVADVGVEEIRHSRAGRLEPVLLENSLYLGALCGVLEAS